MVVIGSGATAVTLVPAMAQTAAHVTMLQRSPTLHRCRCRRRIRSPRWLRRVLPAKVAYPIVRWKNVAADDAVLPAQPAPARARQVAHLRKALQEQLPPGYDVDTHFRPDYKPWDQRLCLVPDGDLFEAISDGRASVVTDQIETFTETGVRLRSRAPSSRPTSSSRPPGCNLLHSAGCRSRSTARRYRPVASHGLQGHDAERRAQLRHRRRLHQRVVDAQGDLTCGYVCRLLAHMDEYGYQQCTPQSRDGSVAAQPFIDFSSSYVLRSIDQFPKQGSRAPWRLYQNYALDVLDFKLGGVDDGVMRFARAGAASPTPVAEAQPALSG